MINTALLEAVNHCSIVRLFADTVDIFGPEFNKEAVLLFIVDAVPYMVKAAKSCRNYQEIERFANMLDAEDSQSVKFM